MTLVRTVVSVLALAGAAQTALAQDPVPVPAAPSPPDVVATVDGTPIGRDALMQRAAAALAALRQAEYELLQQVTDDLVDERLLQNAAGPNSTPTAWLAAQVDKRAALPGEAEIVRFWEQNKGAFGTKTLAEARPEIAARLRNEARRAAEADIRRGLRAAAKIDVRLGRPRFDVRSPDAPTLGEPDAPVTIVAFIDYEDPFTRREHDVLKAVMARFGRQLRFEFRQFPAPFHALAPKAAEAALCAAAQDHFGAYHEALLSTAEPALKPAQLVELGRTTGLDPAAFQACLDSLTMAPRVARDLAEGRAAGVTAPPVYFVNGLRVSGSAPLTEFATVIDEELRRR